MSNPWDVELHHFEAIFIASEVLKKAGGSLKDSFLEEAGPLMSSTPSRR